MNPHEIEKRKHARTSRPLRFDEVLCRGMLLRMLRHGPCKQSNVMAVAKQRGIAGGLTGAMQSLGIVVVTGEDGCRRWELPPNVAAIFPRRVLQRVVNRQRQRRA
jgi:hypothetical protein